MRATITLHAHDGPPRTLVLSRVLSWSVHRPFGGHSTTTIMVEGMGPVSVTGDHDRALREAMDALADVGDDARVIADLTERVAALETAVAALATRGDL